MRQRLRRLLLAPVAASLALVIAPPADASSTPDPVAAGTPQGLLVNAGMEAAGMNDLPDGWEAAGTGKSRGTVVRDAAAARTGSAGVRITALRDASPVALESDKQPAVLPSNVYEYSALVSVLEGAPTVTLSADFLNSSGHVLRTVSAQPLKRASGSGWAAARFTAVTPAATADVRVRVQVLGAGVVLVDDFDMAAKTRYELVPNGGAEQGSGATADGWAASSVQSTPVPLANPSAEAGTT